MKFKLATHTTMALATALALITGPAMADINLVFGTYASDKPTTVVRKFKPFLNYLADRMTEILGEPVKIRMKIDKTYENGISDLAQGNVDFSRFGPASYVTVKDMNPGINIVAMELKDGKKRFNGIIAVHKDSTFTSLSDLKGQSFAFGDELSTIGRYLAQSHLMDAGITGESLKNYQYLGRHDLVGTAVAQGKFAAGALKESTFNKLVEAGEPIEPLMTFENVTKPWLTSSDMSTDVFEAMRDAMLSVADTDVYASISKGGFTTGDDSDYDFIRTAMRRSENF